MRTRAESTAERSGARGPGGPLSGEQRRARGRGRAPRPPHPGARPARRARPAAPPTPSPARASPSSARRCFRRVSTSFLGSSTFWVDFFTSPWLRRENIPPREDRAPRWGGRRRSRASHRIGSGPARVAWATHRPSPCRRRCRLGCDSRKEGGPARHREGRGRKAVSTPDRRPRPAGGASGLLGAALGRVVGDSAQGASERGAGAPSHKEACPRYSLYYKSRDAPRWSPPIRLARLWHDGTQWASPTHAPRRGPQVLLGNVVMQEARRCARLSGAVGQPPSAAVTLGKPRAARLQSVCPPQFPLPQREPQEHLSEKTFRAFKIQTISSAGFQNCTKEPRNRGNPFDHYQNRGSNFTRKCMALAGGKGMPVLWVKRSLVSETQPHLECASPSLRGLRGILLLAS